VSGIWNPTSPAHDSPIPRDASLPVRTYIVCSTPRSGSGLLCRGLASSRCAGAPAEYFNANQRVALSSRWACGPALDDYVAALRAHRASPGAVLGTKLHWDQLEALGAEAGRPGQPAELAELLAELFGNATYVHISREDVDRQAVSFWTALNTGVWSVPVDGDGPANDGPVPYDFEALESCRHEIRRGDDGWGRLFAARHIVPVRVRYEELVADYPATVAATLREIVAPDLAPAHDGAPDSRRQADARSETLLARYREDRARHGQRTATER
jgi:LPS sulfotransferase NodH